MDWDMIREVSKYGDIQCHSYSHPHLTKLTNLEIIEPPKKRVKREKKRL